VKENVFLNYRYMLARIGLNSDHVEIDEAIRFAEIYIEERSGMLCPFLLNQS